MRVIAYDPFLSRPSAPQELGVEKVELDAAAGARRLHHRAHAAHRADQEHPLARQPDEDQEGRAHHQLRARRPGRRAGGARPAGLGPHRRRRASTSSPRSRPRPTSLFGAPNLVVHAASRRRDGRGAGERGAAGRRADGRLPADRRGRELAQHAQRHRPRRRRKLAPYIDARREARLASPASSPTPTSRR